MRREIIALLALTGCQQSDEFAAAKEAVQAELKDPESAQFRGMSTNDDGSVCGEVNAKNSYGGYVGYQPFYTSETITILHQPSDDTVTDAAGRLEILKKCNPQLVSGETGGTSSGP